MRVVTWNVNSIRVRQERLLAFLDRQNPDVVCLQELKVEASKLPRAELEARGWHLLAHTQKTYNGVAILSREPLVDPWVGFNDGLEEDPQARLVAATVRGVRVICVYMPNGGELFSEKWTYKLAWMQRLRAWLDRFESETPLLALCGDFNVAPEEADLHDPAEWVDTPMFHPEARKGLEEVAAFGLVDAFRLRCPDPGVYSWWDYRMLGFPKNRGLRIDHIYTTPALAERVTDAFVDRDERKGQQPSDHAPVLCDFEI